MRGPCRWVGRYIYIRGGVVGVGEAVAKSAEDSDWRFSLGFSKRGWGNETKLREGDESYAAWRRGC